MLWQGEAASTFVYLNTCPSEPWICDGPHAPEDCPYPLSSPDGGEGGPGDHPLNSSWGRPVLPAKRGGRTPYFSFWARGVQ